MQIDWPPRIRKRASGIPGGEALLREAATEYTLREMRRYIREREHPVVALTGALIPDDLPEGAKPNPPLPLKQLAGEITAFICEHVLGAVRTSGSNRVFDNLVFQTGTVFRFPDQIKGKPAPAGIDVRYLGDDELVELAEAVAAEQRRRAG